MTIQENSELSIRSSPFGRKLRKIEQNRSDIVAEGPYLDTKRADAAISRPSLMNNCARTGRFEEILF